MPCDSWLRSLAPNGARAIASVLRGGAGRRERSLLDGNRNYQLGNREDFAGVTPRCMDAEFILTEDTHLFAVAEYTPPGPELSLVRSFAVTMSRSTGQALLIETAPSWQSGFAGARANNHAMTSHFAREGGCPRIFIATSR